MFRTIAAVLIVAASALTAPRPAVTDGYELLLASETPLFNESGDSLALSLFPSLSFNQDGVLFSLFVSPTDALGSYAFFRPSAILAEINYFECPIGGGFCNGSGPINYSLNVVASAVPEPATFGLFGLGLAIMAVRRRPRLSGEVQAAG